MSIEHPANPRSDVGSPVTAALMIILGALTINDTYAYADFDSVVFPRAVAIVLMLLALAILLRWLVQRTGNLAVGETGEPAESGGSWPRRIALVAVMLGAALAMPWIGFQVVGLITFAGLIIIAMHDPWTPFRIVVYPLVGIAIVTGFYLLFAKLLMVPLPVGRWFL